MNHRMCLASVLVFLLSVSQERAADASRVTIPSNGWLLVGSYIAPTPASGGSAVLLLNGAARDRRAYIPLARELERRGVATLRPDLRGEGESTNLGRFEPGRETVSLADSHEDVAAALAWLRNRAGVDPTRIGVLGASTSADAMARAARNGASAAAYVALSPGDFSDESARAIDGSRRPWWFIASTDERFAQTVVRRVASISRTAQTTLVGGTSHASDILSPHYFLNHEIADWFAARLASRPGVEMWGNLPPGPFDVGFHRVRSEHGGRTLLVDTWYPARASTNPMRFQDYLELATDLRGAAPGFPSAAGSVAATLSTAISGDPSAVAPAMVQRVLRTGMAATREAAPAAGRFPLVLWTPRYGTTAAQAVLSEYLAARGFIVAFARPESEGKLPFELKTRERGLPS